LVSGVHDEETDLRLGKAAMKKRSTPCVKNGIYEPQHIVARGAHPLYLGATSLNLGQQGLGFVNLSKAILMTRVNGS
jgi:hypothetical protein